MNRRNYQSLYAKTQRSKLCIENIESDVTGVCLSMTAV
ncbi:hypothetical protein MGSAQ_002996, partial [marine sediment metagenome]